MPPFPALSQNSKNYHFFFQIFLNFFVNLYTKICIVHKLSEKKVSLAYVALIEFKCCYCARLGAGIAYTRDNYLLTLLQLLTYVFAS